MYHQHRYASVLLRCLRPGCRWLDLGAGTRIHGGWQEPTAATLAAIARPVGCDPLPGHLRTHPQLSARVGADGAHLPFADACFDLVSANMVVEHLADPAAVFAEVARVLAPNGQFVFVTPHRRHWIVGLFALMFPPRVRQFIARIEGRDPRHIFLTHYRANTPEALRAMARQSGLGSRVEAFTSWPAGRGVEALAFALARMGPGSNLLGIMSRPARPEEPQLATG
jgi:ubiquinone/menaquinone biosynthesis C-methylase UbiE